MLKCVVSVVDTTTTTQKPSWILTTYDSFATSLNSEECSRGLQCCKFFKVKLSNEKRDICMYIESPKKHYLKPIKLNWPEINQTFKKITFKIEHDHFSKSSILVKMFMESRKWRKLVINPSFALWRTFHNRNQKTRISGTYPTHLN